MEEICLNQEVPRLKNKRMDRNMKCKLKHLGRVAVSMSYRMKFKPHSITETKKEAVRC